MPTICVKRGGVPKRKQYPKTLEYAMSQGGSLPSTQLLTISLALEGSALGISDTTTTATLAAQSSWVSLSSSSGTTALTVNIGITAAAQSFNPGTYQSEITVSSGGTAADSSDIVNSPVFALVKLTVV